MSDEFKVGEQIVCIKGYNAIGILAEGDSFIVKKVFPNGLIELNGIDNLFSSKRFKSSIEFRKEKST